MIRKLSTYLLSYDSLFLMLIASFACYGRFFKPLRPFADSLVHPDWALPGFFEKNIIFFWCDWIAIGFLVLLVIKKFSWRSALQPWANRALIAFFAVACLSVLGSTHPTYGLHYIKLFFLLLPILMYLVATSLDVDREVLAKRVFQVILAIALFECALGAYQFFMQHSYGLKGLGEPALRTRHAWGSTVPRGTSWIIFLEWLFPYLKQYGDYVRPCGTFAHTNIFAGFLVFSLFGNYYLLRAAKRFQGLLILTLAPQIFMLIMTYSRAGVVSYLVGSVLWIIWSKDKKALFFVASLCFLCMAGIFFTLGKSGFDSFLLRGSDGERMTSIQVAAEMVKHHPILGVGFNSYVIEMPHYSEMLWGAFREPVYVHNIYALVMAQTGLLGGMFFLGFIGITLVSVWKRRHEPYIAIFGVSLIAFLIIGLVDFYPIYMQPFLYLFLTTAAMVNSHQS